MRRSEGVAVGCVFGVSGDAAVTAGAVGWMERVGADLDGLGWLPGPAQATTIVAQMTTLAIRFLSKTASH